MSKSDAKHQGTMAVTSVSLEIGYARARRLVESGFVAHRISFRHLLLVCACAVTLAIPLAGCKSAADKKPASPAAVEVAAVVPKSIHLSDEFNGRVASINSVDVRARVTGYVDKVAYREGDSVKRGDLLFVIDPRLYRDALDSAKATLEREKAAAAFADIQAKRAQTLNASNAISQEEYQNRTLISPRALRACMRRNLPLQRQNSICPLRKCDPPLMGGPAEHSSRAGILHRPIKRC